VSAISLMLSRRTVDGTTTMITRWLNMFRSQAVLVVVVVLGAGAGGTIVLLEQHSDASRQAESRIGSVRFTLLDLENAPFSVAPHVRGSAARARARIASDQTFIRRDLGDLIARGGAPAPLSRVQAAVDAVRPTIQQIVDAGASPGGYTGPHGRVVSGDNVALQARVAAILGVLTDVERIYSERAATAKSQAVIGSCTTIFLLLLAFALFYRRARRLTAENARLLVTSMDEAITDPLTGLGNRRAFKRDLEEVLPGVDVRDELMVGMFDLDGFKQYNDTFGHGAGDALLARLAGRLKNTASGAATTYRMGGDEFCLLAQATAVEGERLVRAAVAALSDEGEGWQIGCSWGLAWMPSEATGASDALRLADERMYAQKAGRATAGVQATAALVQVLIERDTDLSTHISRVAELSIATARELGLAEHEITRIGLAAQLHDIGKTAIPESILNKPGPLDDEEWGFVRSHTLVGERIIAAAPSLAHTATLVRSSHERIDGNGYPDRLAGDDIPLGSRIIAVCDAYDAMIAPRPYRNPRSVSDALSELQDWAGSQFDPDIVEAFITVASHRETLVSTPIQPVGPSA
jgi:diguanylate cyclase (GGDEF)-like protein